MSDYLGKNIPKLGFGLMRLPDHEKEIDIEQTKQMVDEFLQAGQTYFDTAYVYDSGRSEEAIKEALVDRYPQESYQLATKLCAWMGPRNAEEAKQQFYTSLDRTGAGYFDFYLLHALQEGNYKKYDEYGIWDFVKELKDKGLIKHWGFSFHASPQLLDEILTEHPDAEFVQLQINYQDWEDSKNQARENYEVARKHNKPVIIMEPLKGGNLANPPEDVHEIFEEVHPELSDASWGIRFGASLNGIVTVLSGMSSIEQMRDNLSYMKDFKPLNEEELEAVNRAQEKLGSLKTIPCTACHYCTDGCPQGIPIPDIFEIRNKQIRTGRLEEARQAYQKLSEVGPNASDCIECGQCESACPQQLEVIQYLKEAGEILE